MLTIQLKTQSKDHVFKAGETVNLITTLKAQRTLTVKIFVIHLKQRKEVKKNGQWNSTLINHRSSRVAFSYDLPQDYKEMHIDHIPLPNSPTYEGEQVRLTWLIRVFVKIEYQNQDEVISQQLSKDLPIHIESPLESGKTQQMQKIAIEQPPIFHYVSMGVLTLLFIFSVILLTFFPLIGMAAIAFSILILVGYGKLVNDLQTWVVALNPLEDGFSLKLSGQHQERFLRKAEIFYEIHEHYDWEEKAFNRRKKALIYISPVQLLYPTASEQSGIKMLQEVEEWKAIFDYPPNLILAKNHGEVRNTGELIMKLTLFWGLTFSIRKPLDFL